MSPGIPCGNKHNVSSSFILFMRICEDDDFRFLQREGHDLPSNRCYPKELSAVSEALSPGLSSTVASNHKGTVNTWKWPMGLKN